MKVTVDNLWLDKENDRWQFSFHVFVEEDITELDARKLENAIEHYFPEIIEFAKGDDNE